MLGGNIYTMKTMELWNLVCGFGLWLFIYVFKFQVNIFFVSYSGKNNSGYNGQSHSFIASPHHNVHVLIQGQAMFSVPFLSNSLGKTSLPIYFKRTIIYQMCMQKKYGVLGHKICKWLIRQITAFTVIVVFIKYKFLHLPIVLPHHWYRSFPELDPWCTCWRPCCFVLVSNPPPLLAPSQES